MASEGFMDEADLVAHEHDVMDVPPAELSGSLLQRAAIVSGACLATMIGASLLRREPPLKGLEVLAAGVGFGRPRVSDRLLPLAVGAAVLVSGAIVLGAIERGLRRLTAHSDPVVRRIASAVSVPVVAFGLDQLVMKEGFVPQLTRALGSSGAFAKYASLGVASAFARH